MNDLNNTAAPVTAPAANVAPTAPAKAANGVKAAPKGKPAPKAAPAPVAPAKRSSRISPVQEAMLDMLKTGPKSVAAMAIAISAKLSVKGKAKVAVSERDVRLAIDRARANKVAIDRVSKGTFGFSKPVAKARVSAPKA